MKAIRNFGILKAIAFITTVFFLISCDPKDEPIPVVKTTKSSVRIGIAQDVKLSSAKLTAVVVPNEDNTSVAFEYQTTNSTWSTKVLPTKFSGKDSIKVTFDLSDLQLNTVYSFRLRAINVAGDTVSTISTFKTYAVSDYDGNLYHTITIGTQTWLQENLKTTHFANGDVIPNVKDATAWSNLTTPAYCYYNNDAKNGEVYGALYTWYVGHDPRGLILGWKTPGQGDYLILRDFLGGTYSPYAVSGPKVMETGNDHWTRPARTATNESGFTAIGNGAFGQDPVSNKFVFMNFKDCAVWWTYDEASPWGVIAEIDQANCWFSSGACHSKTLGAGLRLIK